LFILIHQPDGTVSYINLSVQYTELQKCIPSCNSLYPVPFIRCVSTIQIQAFYIKYLLFHRLSDLLCY